MSLCVFEQCTCSGCLCGCCMVVYRVITEVFPLSHTEEKDNWVWQAIVDYSSHFNKPHWTTNPIDSPEQADIEFIGDGLQIPLATDYSSQLFWSHSLVPDSFCQKWITHVQSARSQFHIWSHNTFLIVHFLTGRLLLYSYKCTLSYSCTFLTVHL